MCCRTQEIYKRDENRRNGRLKIDVKRVTKVPILNIKEDWLNANYFRSNFCEQRDTTSVGPGKVEKCFQRGSTKSSFRKSLFYYHTGDVNLGSKDVRGASYSQYVVLYNMYPNLAHMSDCKICTL